MRLPGFDDPCLPAVSRAVGRGFCLLVRRAHCSVQSGQRKIKERHHGPKILVCPAWPYAIGDDISATWPYVPPDIFARYHRLSGNDVLMVSGSDSHGTPITIRADAEGSTPREVLERFHPRFLETFQRAGIITICSPTPTPKITTGRARHVHGRLNNGYLEQGNAGAALLEQ